MKRFKLLAIVLLAITGISFLSVGVARAQRFTTTLDSKKVINDTVYSFGHTVRIDGVVNGDVFCAGQDVTIGGTVHGDVICAAMNLTVTGKVDGSVRIAGQNVTLDAKVGHAATVAGRQVTVQKNAVVGQDMTLGGDATVAGTVGRDIIVAGDNVRLGGTVGRNVRFTGTQLTLTDGARVKGGLTYTSNFALRTEGDTKITGHTTHDLPRKQEKKGAHIFGRSPMSVIYLISSFVLLCMVLVWFAPQQLHAISEVAVKKMGLTALVGFVSIFAFPFVAFMLAASVIGIPLAILVILASLLTLLLSGPVAAYYLGSMIRPKSKNPLQIMVIGGLILGAVFMLPIIGGLAMFAAYLIGSGSLLLSLKRHMPKPTYKV